MLLCRRCQKPEDNELDLQRNENNNNWLLVIIGATIGHITASTQHSGKKTEVSKHKTTLVNRQKKSPYCETEETTWKRFFLEKCFPKELEVEFDRQQVWGHVVHCCSPSVGEYLSPHGNCHPCDATCLQCSGPEREDCTSCPTTRWEPLTYKHIHKMQSHTAEDGVLSGLYNVSYTTTVKGQFNLKSKIQIFPLTSWASYQSRQFRCELSSLGDISRRYFCLLSNILKLNGALNVVLTEKKVYLKCKIIHSCEQFHLSKKVVPT